jgi:hypothetical protein
MVPHPHGSNVVMSKWVFRHKFCANCSLEHYKAHLACQGFTQRPGIDHDEMFTPMVMSETVHTILSLPISRDLLVHELDVKNAFPHGNLSKLVYCSQLMGFDDPAHPNYIWCLDMSLYELKQARRAKYSRFFTYLWTLGFTEVKSDTSLFIFCYGSEMVYLLLYVDDIVLTASSNALPQKTNLALQREFTLKNLGLLHHFLGIIVEQHSGGLFLHQCAHL